MQRIGITEQGDPCFDHTWISWVKSGKPAILITKDPNKLYAIIELLKDYKLNIITHLCITGNGCTPIEPNVPNYLDSLNGLVKFVNLYGKDRVVLRIDPIIPSKDYIANSKRVLDKAKELLGDNMCRVRISFYDNYPHAQKRLEDAGVKLEFSAFHSPLTFRKKMWEHFEFPELCGEKDMPSTPCLSEIDCKILGVLPLKANNFQRTACECLSNKYELLKSKSQCQHQCKYCFWKKDYDKNKSLF